MNLSRRISIFSSLAVAVLGAIASGLGVFGRGDGSFTTVVSARGEVYEMATGGVYANNARQVVAEGIGWDIFTLAVAVPVLLVATAFMARGSMRGTLVTAGMLGYFAYLHLEYAVTWAFGPLFPIFIVTLALSIIALCCVGYTIAREASTGSDATFPRRRWAALSLGMSGLLTLMWIQRIADGLAATVPALEGETSMTVQALDLGLVVPVSAVIAVAALRRLRIGELAATAFAVMLVAMSAAIGAMMLSAAVVTGTLAVPPLVIFGGASLAGLALAVPMLRGVERSAGARRPSSLRTRAGAPA